MRPAAVSSLLVLGLFAAVGCSDVADGDRGEVTGTPAPSASATGSPSPTQLPTLTPTPVPTASPTQTPVSTATPTPTRPPSATPTPLPTPTPVGEFRVEIVSPADRSTFTLDDGPVTFEARVFGFGDDPEAVDMRFFSETAGVLLDGHPDETGLFTVTTDQLEAGFDVVSVAANLPDGRRSTDFIQIGVCGWELITSFDDSVEGWRAFGDASIDPRGWLELTGAVRDRKGGFFDVSQRLAAGNIRLRMRLSTGLCNEPGPCAETGGADGFALSVFDLPDELALEALLATAEGGGGLGYGVNRCYGDRDVDAFHVEIDTWENNYNGNSEFHTDPTGEDHVEITFDGNPGGSVCSERSDNPHAAIADIEDNEWHTIEVGIIGSEVDLKLDGVEVIRQEVPGYQFKGGFVGFTGTTGFFFNHHRIDELEVQRACVFDPQ